MIDHNRSLEIMFIDFDGVLCRDRFWRSLPDSLRADVDEFLFAKHFPIVLSWMRGRSSSEEVNELLAFFLKIAYTYLWNVFVHDCRTMNVSLGHLRLIQTIRAYVPVVLVTGNMDCFERFTIPALGLDQYFDEIVNSSASGSLKTDAGGRIFADLCMRYGKSTQGALLIDDSEGNRRAMRERGGQAIGVSGWQELSDLLWEIERNEYTKRGAVFDEAGGAHMPPFRERFG